MNSGRKRSSEVVVYAEDEGGYGTRDSVFMPLSYMHFGSGDDLVYVFAKILGDTPDGNGAFMRLRVQRAVVTTGLSRSSSPGLLFAVAELLSTDKCVFRQWPRSRRLSQLHPDSPRVGNAAKRIVDDNVSRLSKESQRLRERCSLTLMLSIHCARCDANCSILILRHDEGAARMPLRTAISRRTGALSTALLLACAGCGAPPDNLDGEAARSGKEVDTLEEKLLAGCDDTLLTNEYLSSPNRQYRLYLQGDGNLALRNASTMTALWASGTNGKSAVKLVLQRDGNLVLYTSSGTAVWATGTVGKGSDSLRLNDSGSLVLYAGNTVVWSANGSSTLSSNATDASQLCTEVSPGPSADACPNDPNKATPGLCGCGIPESNSNCSSSVKQGYISWSGARVDYLFHGAQTNWTGNNNDGVRSTPAKAGDYEIVSFGASHGGNESTDVNVYFDRARMVSQGFQPIGVRGEADKKAEMWVRKNSGQANINVPGDARAYGFLVLDGNDVQLALGSVSWASNESAGQPYRINVSSGTGLKVLTVFSDDSVELLNVGNGSAVYQTWGFGDGDGFAVVLYEPGSTPPSSITVRRYDSGGFQYVALMSTFPKQ